MSTEIIFTQPRSIPGHGSFEVTGKPVSVDSELARQLIRQGVAVEPPKAKPTKSEE